MELPVASTPLAREGTDATRRTAGSTTAAGPDDSFRAHWQTTPPASEPARERRDDEPPGSCPLASAAPGDVGPSAEPSTAESTGTPHGPVPASPAAGSPAAAGTQSPGEPSSGSDAADFADPSAQRPHPKTPASPTSPNPHLAGEPAQPTVAAAPVGKSLAPRVAPAPVVADVSAVARHVTAHERTVDESLSLAGGSSAVAENTAPRRAGSARGEGRHRAAGVAHADGTLAGDHPAGAETAPRSVPRAPLTTAAGEAHVNLEVAPRREPDASLAEAPPEGGSRGDQGVRAAGLSQRLADHLTTRPDASSTSAVQVTPAEQQRLLQRVARALEAAAERGGVLRLRLRPPELGSLRLEVALEPGKLTARIETETPQARAILLDNLPQLRARLAEQGIVIERFDVDVSARDADQSSSGPRDWDRPGTPATPPRSPARAQATAPEPPPGHTSVFVTSPGTLNVVI